MTGTTVHIDGDLLKALVIEKRQSGASLGSMARIAISEWLGRRKTREVIA